MGSTLYLIDTFNEQLNGAVRSLDTAYTSKDITGNYAIALRDEVPLTGTPTTKADLLTRKHLGLLALHPGFADIVFDDGQDATGWNLGAAFTSGYFGDRGSIRVTSAESVTVPLVSTPAQAVLYWEAYLYTDSLPRDGIFQRVYEEQDASVFTAQVSFDGGLTFISMQEGVIETIPPANQGSQLVVRF
jgi:hypothetical protein